MQRPRGQRGARAGGAAADMPTLHCQLVRHGTLPRTPGQSLPLHQLEILSSSSFSLMNLTAYCHSVTVDNYLPTLHFLMKGETGS